MLRLASDEDVHEAIVRGLIRRVAGLDLVRVVDEGLGSTPDPQILEWAAREGRVLITADVNTMVGAAYERIEQGRPVPGVLALTPRVGIGLAIEDITLVVECGTDEDVRNQVKFIPL